MALNVIQNPCRSRSMNPVFLFAHITVGATGAPTQIAGRGLTVTRTAVGDYTVTLSDSASVPEILHVDVTINDQADSNVGWVGKGFTGSAGARTAWSFTTHVAGVSTELASGDSFTVMVVARNSGQD